MNFQLHLDQSPNRTGLASSWTAFLDWMIIQLQLESYPAVAGFFKIIQLELDSCPAGSESSSIWIQILLELDIHPDLERFFLQCTLSLNRLEKHLN